MPYQWTWFRSIVQKAVFLLRRYLSSRSLSLSLSLSLCVCVCVCVCAPSDGPAITRATHIRFSSLVSLTVFCMKSGKWKSESRRRSQESTAELYRMFKPNVWRVTVAVPRLPMAAYPLALTFFWRAIALQKGPVDYGLELVFPEVREVRFLGGQAGMRY